MDAFQALTIQLLGFAALVYGYGLALRESGMGLADELAPPAATCLRRRMRIWLGVALLLNLIMLGLWAYAFGMAEAARYVGGAGTVLLMQTLALAPLLPVGGAWAARLGHDPWYGLRRVPLRQRALEVALLVMLMLAWTLILKILVPHQIPATLPGRFDLRNMPAALQLPLVIGLLTLAPIVEEAFFRHYLLHRIAGAWRGRPGGLAVAIAGNSILFGIAHYGALEPFWLKWVQSAGLGVMLSILCWRRGVESAIAAHWCFNSGLLLLGLAGIKS